MSVVSITRKSTSKSSSRRSKSGDSLMRKSLHSASFISEHGSKFGRSVSRFPKPNDPALIQSASTVNSRVFRTIINFPLKINSKLPDLTHMEATDCIRELGSFIDIVDYEFNVTSFWLLDILSKLIKHMQLNGLTLANQNIHLLWFRFVLRCISISGDLREELFSLLQKMFFETENYIKAGKPIPQPEDVCTITRKSTTYLPSNGKESMVSSKSLLSVSSRKSQGSISEKSLSLNFKTSFIRNTSNMSQSKKNSYITEDKVAKNLQILHSIIEMIYTVFADRFIFSLISQSYSSPTIVVPLEIPLAFKIPKLLRPAREETPSMPPSAKKSSKSKNKSSKSQKKSSKSRKKSSTSQEELSTSQKKSSKSQKKSSTSRKKSSKSQTKSSPKTDKKGKGKKKQSRKGSPASRDEDDTVVDKKKKNSKKGKGKKSEFLQPRDGDEAEIKRVENESEQINDKMKENLTIFNRAAVPPKKLETKKMEIEDQSFIGILPLSEGVKKGYVENLINSILSPETKLKDNAETIRQESRDKSPRKSKRSSSSKGKKKKSSVSTKKTKGKKKQWKHSKEWSNENVFGNAWSFYPNKNGNPRNYSELKPAS